MKKEIIATMKGETFVDKSDDLLFYIQKVFFMMINIRYDVHAAMMELMECRARIDVMCV